MAGVEKRVEEVSKDAADADAALTGLTTVVLPTPLHRTASTYNHSLHCTASTSPDCTTVIPPLWRGKGRGWEGGEGGAGWG